MNLIDGVPLTSLETGIQVFIDPMRTLPLTRFIPKPVLSKAENKRKMD